jgi:hypothetical protein
MVFSVPGEDAWLANFMVGGVSASAALPEEESGEGLSALLDIGVPGDSVLQIRSNARSTSRTLILLTKKLRQRYCENQRKIDKKWNSARDGHCMATVQIETRYAKSELEKYVDSQFRRCSLCTVP